MAHVWVYIATKDLMINLTVLLRYLMYVCVCVCSTALRVILLTKEADLPEEMNTELGMIAFDDSWDYIGWTTLKKEYKK
jgi:hypothetical protein